MPCSALTTVAVITRGQSVGRQVVSTQNILGVSRFLSGSCHALVSLESPAAFRGSWGSQFLVLSKPSHTLHPFDWSRWAPRMGVFLMPLAVKLLVSLEKSFKEPSNRAKPWGRQSGAVLHGGLARGLSNKAAFDRRLSE